jgi:thiol-disulfide isomerase/thioredoxin
MPRSRLSLPSFLTQARTSRMASLRLPLLAPLLASALAAMAACAGPSSAGTSSAPTSNTSNTTSNTSAAELGAPAAQPAAAAPKVDDSLTGVVDEPAKPWTVSQWFNSAPLSLEAMRGKVVLVRWFMGPSCPFCSATAPTLRALDEKYRDKGLAVIGMYHHKEETPLDPEQVGGWVKQYGYKFPVAIDKDWTTLDRWWLGGHERSFTSVSFLIDKTGVVRRVHLGGKLTAGAELDAMTADIERLIAMK